MSAATHVALEGNPDRTFFASDPQGRINDIVRRIGNPLLRISAGWPGIADPEPRIGDPGARIDDPEPTIGTVSRRIDAGRCRIDGRQGRIGESPSPLGQISDSRLKEIAVIGVKEAEYQVGRWV